MRVTLESRNRPIANILVQLKHCLLYFLPPLLHIGQSFVLIQQKCNNKSYNFSLKFLLRLPNMSSLFAAGLCLLSVAICYLNLFIDQTEKASTLTGTNVIIKWQCFFLWQRWPRHFHFLLLALSLSIPFTCSHFHFHSIGFCSGKHFVNLGSPWQALVCSACQPQPTNKWWNMAIL